MAILRLFFVTFILAILSKNIDTAVPFKWNPGCTLTNCTTPGYPGVFYASHFVGEKEIHILYSSFDELTISIFETERGIGPEINYTLLMAGDYKGAVNFSINPPSNSFSLIARRLIQFVDKDDTGKMNEQDNTSISYRLKDISGVNATYQENSTSQPSFQIPLDMIDGLLTIDIIFPGEATRDTKFPHLQTTDKSYFLNIALTANKTSAKTRFGLEMYLTGFSIHGSRLLSTRYIDDQYTPGIFNVWQLKTNGDFYPAAMLWKPVVYLTAARSIEDTTLMQTYDIKNNVSLDTTDRGLFLSLYNKPYVSAFNISLGRANDGFFVKTNYSFIQFTIGLEKLEPDSTAKFVSLAFIIALALPAIVALIAIVFIVRRRFIRAPPTSYDAIRD